MSYSLKEDVDAMLRELIEQVLGLNNETEAFKHYEKSAITQVRNAECLYFTNPMEIDRIIDSLSRKFEFHGFSVEAKELKRIYHKLLPNSLAKTDRLNRLNVIKFLLNVSESPTSNLPRDAKTFEKSVEEDVIVDWPKYLLEGVAWAPPPDDESSDEWSDDTINDDLSIISEDTKRADSTTKLELQTTLEDGDLVDCFQNHHDLKINLSKHIQYQWFNNKCVRFRPCSNDEVANVAHNWDNYIQQFTRGLIPIENSNIVSEYKIMREVLWQLYEPHASYCFAFSGNLLLPKANVTIASVRTRAFESFLHEFTPYINWLQTLREFHESLTVKIDDEIDVPPDTYNSYDFAIQTIIQPIFEKLQVIEDNIKVQKNTTTLLTLAHELRPLFEEVKILKDIHNDVILDFKKNTSLHCATTLLSRLHSGLFFASSKLEQDLFLTLYLHSLYKYFTIINSWLCRDILEDNTGEFVIADKVQKGEQDWQMEFSIKNLDDNAKSDGLLNIICTQVLQVGKNIHLLRLLGKLHLASENTEVHKDTLYEAYIEKILKNISLYFDVKNDDDEGPEVCDADIVPTSPTYVFPATCPDECKYLTEMDKLENLVDTNDGFLVQAFESFFIKKPNLRKEEAQISLFEKIRKLTKTLFPVQQIVEQVFVETLKERFCTSGLIVKNVLITDYNLEKHFSFLRSIFLYHDELIFPFYRHIFLQLDSGGIWGNHTWLTSRLQDIIMDTYPELYMECTVEVKDSWKLCTDPLKACRMINIHYRIRWPVNIIIRDEHIEMYKGIFQFVLKIKWALYTLNHLFFTELEPKGKPAKQQHKSLRLLISKLKLLRFGLVNIMSNIQHYVLGHIFSKFSKKFDKAFDEAYDLESLMRAHSDFIQALYKACCDFQEYNSNGYGFYLLLYLVRKLRIMWKNPKGINDQELDKCEKSYLMCHKNIDPIIIPVGLNAYPAED